MSKYCVRRLNELPSNQAPCDTLGQTVPTVKDKANSSSDSDATVIYEPKSNPLKTRMQSLQKNSLAKEVSNAQSVIRSIPVQKL